MKKEYTNPVVKFKTIPSQPILAGSGDERFKVNDFANEEKTTILDDDGEE